MTKPLTEGQTIKRMFCGLTEQAFLSELGITDTRMVDYVSRLLTRFIHNDTIFAIRDAAGKRLRDMAEMMLEAERPCHKGDARRELFRHIGDFALFWSGVYPEALRGRRSYERKDALLDFSEQGKRSYFIASTYSDSPYDDEAPVLRRLSEEFELCCHGLRRVRSMWEESQPADG